MLLQIERGVTMQPSQSSNGRRSTAVIWVVILFFGSVFGSALIAESVEAVDAAGRTVVLDVPPERIIVAGKAIPLILDVLYMFPGAVEKTVAVGRFFQGDGEFFRLLDSSFPELPMLEQNFGPEQVAVYSPDIIIMKSYTRRSMGEPLEAAGVPVFYVDLETPDSFFRDVVSLGTVFGMESRAEEIVGFYRERMALVVERVAAAGLRKPTVLLGYYSDVDGRAALNIPPAAWMQTILVELGGGTPVWSDESMGSGWSKVGMEQIADWDPDVILLTAYREDVVAIHSRLESDSIWKLLPAVRQERFYAFPGDYFSWDQPNARWILGLLWTARRLHPNAFADLDLKAHATAFFDQMYLLPRDTIRSRVLPKVQASIDGW
jgi:iron complex transport system substrate-binding protein